MIERTLKVPKELQSSFFFPENKINWKKEEASLLSEPFMYEAVYFSQLEDRRPWENSEEATPLLLLEWSDVKEKLDALFKSRDKNGIKVPMKKGIALFVQFLHWANERPVQLSPQINYETLIIKPVNIEERLEFIFSRPFSYHSYKQLEELMVELEKVYNKELVMKKLK